MGKNLRKNFWTQGRGTTAQRLAASNVKAQRLLKLLIHIGFYPILQGGDMICTAQSKSNSMFLTK